MIAQHGLIQTQVCDFFWLVYCDFYNVFKEELSHSPLELFAVRKYLDYSKHPMGSFRHTFGFPLVPVDFL